jgi:hypothetical protein
LQIARVPPPTVLLPGKPIRTPEISSIDLDG